MERGKLRLRQLEALMAVSDHGSITNAATELGISQPAVSRLLSDLGDSLGFSLFDRKKGQMIPSQEVRFLQPDIRRVLELMRQISDVSQEIRLCNEPSARDRRLISKRTTRRQHDDRTRPAGAYPRMDDWRAI